MENEALNRHCRIGHGVLSSQARHCIQTRGPGTAMHGVAVVEGKERPELMVGSKLQTKNFGVLRTGCQQAVGQSGQCDGR
jgi:hypothetical protein